MSDPVEDLEAASDRVETAEERVAEIGEDRLERLAEAYRSMLDLLDEYEEPASGSGRETFESYVEFEGEVADFVERLPDDLLRREAFERAEDAVDKRRLSADDFERARGELEPAADLVSRLEEREAAREAYRDARRAVRLELRDVEERIDRLESVLAFGDVDFDAPVARLRDPIQTYNEAVREEFRSFRSEAPAREVVSFLDSATAYPLVSFPPIPEELREYLLDHPAGEEPVPTLLEYADYSVSKLDHYVEDARTFRARVAGNRTYLDRIDAEPLTVAWPPPPARRFRWRARELVAVVDRFAGPGTVARLHEVRDLARDPEYRELRRVAEARAELDDDQRERLRSGEAARELDAAREKRERLERALSEYPSL